MLKEGDKAPSFTLPDQDGENIRLSDFKDKTVVLYFYPKDMTPGCTKEACSFRDNITTLKRKKVVVLGVSKDSVERHKKFAEMYELPFLLLSDPEAKVIKAYGAWGKKKLYGKEYEGIIRTTFMIKNNKIIKVYNKVNCPTHAEDILKEL